MISKQFIAVRAVIFHEGRLLIIRESGEYEGGANKGKWDFPGGKIGLGESLHDALIREVKEETGLEIKIQKVFHVDEWRPTVNGETLQIIGIFFLCEAISSNVLLSNDHDEFKWINPKEMDEYDLLEQKKRAIKALNL